MLVDAATHPALNEGSSVPGPGGPASVYHPTDRFISPHQPVSSQLPDFARLFRGRAVLATMRCSSMAGAALASLRPSLAATISPGMAGSGRSSARWSARTRETRSAGRAVLDQAQTPAVWMMMEKRRAGSPASGYPTELRRSPRRVASAHGRSEAISPRSSAFSVKAASFSAVASQWVAPQPFAKLSGVVAKLWLPES